MPGRIEWGRYEGDDIESVIAMMLNREHPDSVRIRPSQGDGGVDILDRGAGPAGGDVVYQVKKFWQPLTSGDKDKIRHSLETLLHPSKRDERWGHLTVTEWRLVMPWDPTPEADDWFHNTLLEEYDVKGQWDGLVRVDQLAARYDDVVDYYLRDGKSAVVEAMENAMRLMTLDKVGDADLSPAEVAQKVRAALPALDHDPHYLYEFRFGHGEPRIVDERPRLVMSTYSVDPAADTWHAIDLIARCAASASERPVTVRGEFTAQPGSDFAEALQDFDNFGTPFTSPEGAYRGTIDAPGGLGGELVDATVTLGPTPASDLGDDVQLRLEMLGVDGAVLASADVDRTDRSVGQAGLRVVLTEVHGVFDLTMIFNQSNGTTTGKIDVRAPSGKPVAAARPGVAFAANFHHPHTLRTSARHAPANLGATLHLPPGDAEGVQTLKFTSYVLGLLEKLQAHTSVVIRVPSGEDVLAQFKSWQLAAAVLSDQPVTVGVAEDHAFHVAMTRGVELPRDSFVMEVPNEVMVGSDRLKFGTMFASFEHPTLLETVNDVDGVTYSFTTADRKVGYSRTSPEG